MNSIIKKNSFLILCILVLQSCVIQNPKQGNYDQLEITIEEVYEGRIKGIIFSGADEKTFYINRGLEQRLTLQEMKNKVLNKKVTLHLAKIKTGALSNHIAQLSLGQEVYYSEFN